MKTNEKRLRELAENFTRLPTDDLFYNIHASITGLLDTKARSYFATSLPNISDSLNSMKIAVDYLTMKNCAFDVDHIITMVDSKRNNHQRSLQGAAYIISLYGQGRNIPMEKSRELIRFLNQLAEVLDCVGFNYSHTFNPKEKQPEILTR
ncbi:hypothetical protein GF340_04100 [Candidatus Peregrinibacteria bacterium]|nr:hypothetical protein [Candidatus Peregrinibacteria bacterium]